MRLQSSHKSQRIHQTLYDKNGKLWLHFTQRGAITAKFLILQSPIMEQEQQRNRHPCREQVNCLRNNHHQRGNTRQNVHRMQLSFSK